jgi:hypothetical protein
MPLGLMMLESRIRPLVSRKQRMYTERFWENNLANCPYQVVNFASRPRMPANPWNGVNLAMTCWLAIFGSSLTAEWLSQLYPGEAAFSDTGWGNIAGRVLIKLCLVAVKADPKTKAFEVQDGGFTTRCDPFKVLPFGNTLGQPLWVGASGGLRLAEGAVPTKWL